jgi:predicted DCC family thiol-disulfide oxidoreductase YuxK
MEPWHLYYDGGCNLCNKSKLVYEKWAQKAGIPFIAEPLMSTSGLEKGFTGDQMILERDGVQYSASNAWLELMRLAPWYLRWIYWTRNAPILRPIYKFFYNKVAHNRIKWFGSASCEIPRQK